MTSVFYCETLLAFAVHHLVLKAKLACYWRYFLTSYFCIPMMKKHLFLILVLGLVDLHRII